ENLINNLTKKINSFPIDNRNLLSSGSNYVGIQKGLRGFLAKSSFHIILSRTQTWLRSGIAVAVVKFLTRHVSFKIFFSLPHSTFDLQCLRCTANKVNIFGLKFEGFYLFFMAAPV
uniref:Transmembrane protein 126A n=1 Tax=Sus scrofa TaxID=9823 RepID=A0A8D1YYB8_PIG